MDVSKLFQTLVIGGGLIGCHETISIETEEGIEECCPERCYEEGNCTFGQCSWLSPQPEWCSVSDECREAVTGQPAQGSDEGT